MGPGSEHRATDLEDDGGRALHARLLRGEPTAPSDLATVYLQPLVDWLHRTFRREDEALLETVAIELILKVGRAPDRYDPDRSALSAYLRMAARRDVQNALQRERRRTARQISLDDVELSAPARNREWASASDPADAVIEAFDRERLLALREHFSAQDWEVVLLRIERERRTERYAAVLGLRDRPPIEQEREVKRVKDRVMKRLRRLWKKRYGDD